MAMVPATNQSLQQTQYLPPNEESERGALLAWYASAKRDLPWRINRDPYRIWVSEVMLQQTTVAAVIPYYERFMRRFPTLLTLANSPVESVLEHWAGLGYYGRARNLHKAARILSESGFPKTFADLSQLPGFGPYTARAVSSLAFDEKTGVLDGNVIRVLSRRYALSLEWWKPRHRDELQSLADRLAQVESPSDWNQAMMELGATVCTPQSPACPLCPWSLRCEARARNTVDSYPSKRPRREREIWAWHPDVITAEGRILLVKNDYAPFLKGHWIPPGHVERLDSTPESYDYRGSVTHYDIFVSVQRPNPTRSNAVPPINVPVQTTVQMMFDAKKWVHLSELKKEIPAALIRKAIEKAEK